MGIVTTFPSTGEFTGFLVAINSSVESYVPEVQGVQLVIFALWDDGLMFDPMVSCTSPSHGFSPHNLALWDLRLVPLAEKASEWRHPSHLWPEKVTGFSSLRCDPDKI